MTDITDMKSLSNRNVIIMVVFLLSSAIVGTYYVTKDIMGTHTAPIISQREKSLLLSHLDKDLDRELYRQKVELKQKAFNDMILQSLTNNIQELAKINNKVQEVATDLTIHKTNNRVHLQ